MKYYIYSILFSIIPIILSSTIYFFNSSVLVPGPAFYLIGLLTFGTTFKYIVPIFIMIEFIFLTFLHRKYLGVYIPAIFVLLNSLLSIAFIIYLVSGVGWGIKYQGLFFTIFVIIGNIFLITLSWRSLLKYREKKSYSILMEHLVIFNSWLFWYSFPFFGEMGI